MSDIETALQLHRSGRWDEAARLYGRILAAEPDNAGIHNNLGTVLQEQGNVDAAIESYRRALEIEPGMVGALCNLGVALQERFDARSDAESLDKALRVNPNYVARPEDIDAAAQDRAEDLSEAIVCYRRAIAIDGGHPEIHNNLGVALQQSGAFPASVECYRRAVAIDPDFFEAHNNLGKALQELGERDEASACYRKVIKLAPDHAEAHCLLGGLLIDGGRFADAEREILEAIRLNPENDQAYTELGVAFVGMGRFEEAQEVILYPVERARSPERPPVLDDDVLSKLNETKLRHDIEQLEYLRAGGKLDPTYAAVAPEYERVLGAMDTRAYARMDRIEPPVSDLFARTYNRLLHVAPAPVLRGPTLNPALKGAAIEADFRGGDPRLVVIDDFLSADAVEGLRRFCLDSTIWFNVADAGDVGATMANGFACPLLFQIVRDIRELFPAVLGHHQFASCWAYKYYGHYSGVDMHADEGAVSVNFWITPDEANCDETNGGLVFWNKRAPMDYFRKSRIDKNKLLHGLANEPDANPIRVPHRCNRAALFDSRLTHKTDELHFRDGYENRRINVTLVFGKPSPA
jgi:tetratricopeptide (TPR) repeat protein